MGAQIASGIDITNSHREATQTSHPKVWDHEKMYTEATKTKPVHLVSNDGDTEH